MPESLKSFVDLVITDPLSNTSREVIREHSGHDLLTLMEIKKFSVVFDVDMIT